MKTILFSSVIALFISTALIADENANFYENMIRKPCQDKFNSKNASNKEYLTCVKNNWDRELVNNITKILSELRRNQFYQLSVEDEAYILHTDSFNKIRADVCRTLENSNYTHSDCMDEQFLNTAFFLANRIENGNLEIMKTSSDRLTGGGRSSGGGCSGSVSGYNCHVGANN